MIQLPYKNALWTAASNLEHSRDLQATFDLYITILSVLLVDNNFTDETKAMFTHEVRIQEEYYSTKLAQWPWGGGGGGGGAARNSERTLGKKGEKTKKNQKIL
jgi:hypothetical protein